MKCHAGVEFESGKPCPRCNAKLGEVCWPGINADLMEVVELRKDNERLAMRLSDVVMMLDTPDAYNREYIAAVCRSILSLVSSTDKSSRASPAGFTFSTAADMIDEAAATTDGFNLKEIAAWLRAISPADRGAAT